MYCIGNIMAMLGLQGKQSTTIVYSRMGRTHNDAKLLLRRTSLFYLPELFVVCFSFSNSTLDILPPHVSKLFKLIPAWVTSGFQGAFIMF